MRQERDSTDGREKTRVKPEGKDLLVDNERRTNKRETHKGEVQVKIEKHDERDNSYRSEKDNDRRRTHRYERRH